MKVTFLGTGTSQGVPVIGCKCAVCRSGNVHDKRLRTSVLLQVNGLNIVIDSGPDFRQQMLRCGIDHLDALIFTHGHKDHTAGLDDIRAFNFIQGGKVEVYATSEVQDVLRREFSYIFDGTDYPGIPQIKMLTIANSPFQIDDVTVTPIETLHYKLPVFGFRVGDFTYITDANYIPKKEKEKIKGSKVMVLNALRKTSHISHFTLDEAVELMHEFAPQHGFLTHISHQLGLHTEVNAELPDFVRLAHDGLTFEL